MIIEIKQALVGLLSGDGVRAQFLRYALTGVAITAFQIAIYWGLAGPLAVDVQLANFAGYIAAVVSGYVLHGRISFAGHGERDKPMARAFRFMAVSLLSYALNAFWVWGCVTWAHWPVWTPIPLMVFVTPALVFVLNRQWVFR
jgi:putative flippase GtrA